MAIPRDKFGRFAKGKKREPRSEAVKRKISKANKGENNGMYRSGNWLLREGICKECGKAFLYRRSCQKGIYCSRGCANKSKNPVWLHTKEAIRKSVRRRKETYKEENHPNWKGENAGYVSLHRWVVKTLGTPSHCELCGITEKRRYEWANRDGRYLRDGSNWMRACVPCHRKYDIEHGLHHIWSPRTRI